MKPCRRDRLRSTFWLRVAAGALLAVFALPSCITSNLWRSRYQADQNWVPSHLRMPDAGTAGARDEAAAFALDVRPLGETIARLCNPPRTQPVQWLLLRPRQNAESVRTMLATKNKLQVQIVRDAREGRPPVPRCLLFASLGGVPPEDPRLHDLPGTYRHIGLGGVSYHYEVECDVALLDASPAGGERADVVLQFLNGPDGTFECALVTPVTVALDAVLLPFQVLLLLGG